MHKDVVFTACGLMSVDYTMLLTVLNATIYYVVVLIQFDVATSYNIPLFLADPAKL